MRAKHFTILTAALLLAFSQGPGLSGEAQAAKKKKPAKTLDPLYGRMAQDLAEKKPLVVTIYVTLCDNDTTILIKVPNEKLCHGEKPGSNIYWGTSGGLRTYLESAGWNKLAYDKNPNEKLIARGLWKKTFPAGGALEARGLSGSVDVVIVGLAYRGKMFKESLKDYLKAVHRDKASILKDTALGDLAYGGRSHVVGYIGHDYFMNDEHYDELMSQAKGGSKLEKGVFALSCFGKQWIQPAVSRKNTHILLMNRSTTYPGAWAVGGLIQALTQGKDGAGIHRAAAEAFAEGKKMPLESILNAFSYGG